jgi:hypothetical protein
MLDVTEAFDLPPQCALQEVFLIDGFEDPAPL